MYTIHMKKTAQIHIVLSPELKKMFQDILKSRHIKASAWLREKIKEEVIQNA